MKKQLKIFLIVVFAGAFTIIGSFIVRQLLLQTVEVSIYCKSTNSMGVILYADNCSGEYPFGSGGPCIAMPLNESNEIQKIKYIIPKGTENKIRFDLDVSTYSDFTISYIEIKYPNFKKVLKADSIAKLFIEVDENSLNADGMLLLNSIHDITSLCCVDHSSVKKVFSPDWIFAWKCMAVTFLVMGIIYAIYMFYTKQNKIRYNRFSQIIIITVSAVIIAYTSLLFEKKSLGSFENGIIPFKVMIWNIIVLWWTILLITCISNFKFGVIVTALLMSLYECVNYFKLALRQENFLPWDLKLAHEAVSVIDISDLPWNIWMLLLGGVIVMAVILIYPINLGTLKKISLKIRLISLTGLLLLGIYGGRMICVKNEFTIYQFDIAGAYRSNGMLISFLYFCQNMGNEKPDGYTQDAINKIAQSVSGKEDNNVKEKAPNIIMVMSEAFWNPEVLSDIEYNEHFMERFKEISGKACSGNVLSPRFGGGTCDVEFEALTGFSMDYIQNGLMPYIGVIQDDFFSVAQYLKSKGYYTVAMHPNAGSYYRREKIYPLLGFQRSIFGDEFEQDVVRVGWLRSDDAVVNKIIEVYSQNKSDSDSPQFIFAVTIQNHQPYGEESILKNEASTFIPKNLDVDTVKRLDDFSSGINASSDAFGRLIDYFADCEEPTIVVYWGDHMVSLGNNYGFAYEAGYMKENDDADFLMYLTPIVIWDNYIGLNEELETRSTFQIMPTVFSLYDLEMPEYFRFLNNIQTYSLGRSHHKVVLDSGGYVNTMEDKQVDDAYRQMELLQYDYIYGEKYANSTLFNTLEP